MRCNFICNRTKENDGKFVFLLRTALYWHAVGNSVLVVRQSCSFCHQGGLTSCTQTRQVGICHDDGGSWTLWKSTCHEISYDESSIYHHHPSSSSFAATSSIIIFISSSFL
jgi:hypothetical protein